MKPLLKWAGGKRQLVAQIVSHFPQYYRNYFEPFCGGAAIFFSIEPENAILSDLNADLIECYRTLSLNCEPVIGILSNLPNTEAEYYRIRSWHPSNANERAAKLLYLCRLSFNGIYRVNLRGIFNVPYGRKTHLDICQPDLIRAASAVLRRATLIDGDFAIAIQMADRGDIVYFDPPYTVAHNQNGFVKYNSHLFSWQDQERLAHEAERLRRLGCYTFVSNADHHSIRRLYPQFREVIIQRHSIIAATGEARRQVTESLFIGIPQ